MTRRVREERQRLLTCSCRLQVQLALLTATVKLFIKRPTAGQELVPKVLKWATEDVDNPDLRDRGFIYWRLLSTDPGAATSIVFSDKPTISTELETMDRGQLDRLLLHTGTLASLYGKEPQTFVRGAQPKFLHDSPALDPAAKQSYLDSITLPAPHHRPNPIALDPTLSPPPPAVPPKPTRSNSNYGRQDSLSLSTGGGGDYGLGVSAGGAVAADLVDDEDEEEEAGLALNPGAEASRAPPSPLPADDEALDPYESLSRMSMDGFGMSGAGGGGGGGAYGYETQQPRRGVDESLL